MLAFEAPRGRENSARTPAPAFDAVAIASSAGGVVALITLVEALPPDFPAPIIVAQHLPRGGTSFLAEILQRHSALRVTWAIDAARLRPRTIYVAPQQRSTCVDRRHRLVVSRAPSIGPRPAADPLFTSLAAHCGRVAAVVLSGSGDDGTNGAVSVRAAGGVVLVQDPATSLCHCMPKAAIDAETASFVLPLASIAPALVTLVMVPGAAAVFGLASGAA